MKKVALRPRPSLLLLLTLTMIASGYAVNGRATKPRASPKLSPAPSSVMRSTRAEQSLRVLLSESEGMQATSSAPFEAEITADREG